MLAQGFNLCAISPLCYLYSGMKCMGTLISQYTDNALPSSLARTLCISPRTGTLLSFFLFFLTSPYLTVPYVALPQKLLGRYAGAISGTLYVCLLPILVHLSALKTRQLLTKSAVALHLLLILGGTALFANGLI